MKQIWQPCALKRKLDVGQFPYNPLLKATLIFSSFTTMKQSIYYNEYCLATWIAATEENQILSFDLRIISVDHGFRIWHTRTEEIRVGALVLPRICGEYGVETLLSPTERIRVLALELHPTCAENGQETLFGNNGEIRVF